MSSDKQSIDTVYITGWEYNLLLDPDPAKSNRASGLPANVLWNNGSLFWLFKHVQCPKRAYEGELSASINLQWPSGTIFKDLKDEIKVLKLFDLNTGLSKLEQDELLVGASQLRPTCNRDLLYKAIYEGDDSRLDRIKWAFLGPVLAKRGWKAVLGLKSVSHWTDRQMQDVTPACAVRTLAQLFEHGAASPILPSPNKLVSEGDLQAQDKEEEITQKNLIPSLLLGELDQDEYERKVLAGDMSKYEPLNAGMKEAWKKGKETLKRLRGAAEELLWDRLHKTWLPEIQSNPKKLKELTKHMSIAIRKVEEKAKVEAGDTGSDLGFTASIIGVTVAVTSIMSSLGCDPGQIGLAGGLVPSALSQTKSTLQRPIDELLLSKAGHDDVNTLSGFYQKARTRSD